MKVISLNSVIGVVLLAILSTLGAGCAYTNPGPLKAVAVVSDQPRVGNVYLLRGFIGIFSAGMDTLGEKLNERGVHAVVFQDDQWSRLAEAIETKYRARPDHEPIILVGHSYGADDSLRIARRLAEANIPVDLLITLDPVTPPAVPKNVKTCVNLYQSNGVIDALPWLRGIPLTREDGSISIVINADIRTERPDLWDAPLDHFNIEKKPQVQEEIIKRMLSVCVPRREWTATPRPPTPAVVTSGLQTQNGGIRSQAQADSGASDSSLTQNR